MNLDNFTDISRSDVLRALGLGPRVRDYIWPAIGVFATGALVGAGAALLFAPKSGAKLRAEIRDEFRSQLEDIERKLGMHKHPIEADAEELDKDEQDDQHEAA
ncbi:YtxH domain-containing protein [Enhygromyxa salina]|uniref:YtxH-like protein n=1 Tax=Enhygromyxa salina TaxID=215803 RepID=A0A2S9YHK7_9BACT|nr:YtxH domain-containing protein [Enhygromyxa salina]PRQ04590.1 YtxH-like protein [Enhygromyxa salina]